MTAPRTVVILTCLSACTDDALVVMSVPTPGSVGVSVLVQPVVQQPARHLELRALGRPGPIPARIVEDTDQIRIGVLEPLAYATVHTLWVEDEPYTFRTASPSVYATYRYDEHGNRLEATGYAGPGPDGIWFNADDEIRSQTLYAAFDG
ncbi:MAG: hypothetical protein KTR31_40180 [Myxococcales bacterium]|nr:hypothetical protein [Myxococcales bacterium]